MIQSRRAIQSRLIVQSLIEIDVNLFFFLEETLHLVTVSIINIGFDLLFRIYLDIKDEDRDFIQSSNCCQLYTFSHIRKFFQKSEYNEQ